MRRADWVRATGRIGAVERTAEVVVRVLPETDAEIAAWRWVPGNPRAKPHRAS